MHKPSLHFRCGAIFRVSVSVFLLITSNAMLAAEPGSFKDCIDPRVYTPPKTYPQVSMDKGEVKAIFYEALPYKGKPTRAFAYVGIPKSEDGKKVPGMVLIHGGGGTAFAEWVRVWNEHGYAAIAMDLEGHVPDDQDPHKRPTHDHSGPARVGLFRDADLPIEQQWMYHALSDILLAHSLLASMDGVDPDRIGITGASWGGILCSLIAGVDRRYKCAVPIYGAGFLYESKANFREVNSPDPQVFAKRKFWDPANYFADATIPMLWMNGDRDTHFSINITSHSSQSTKGPSTLSIHPAMPHGHPPAYNPDSVPEVYVFVDSILKGGTPLARIVKQPFGIQPVVEYQSPHPIKHADAYYLTEPLAYKPNNQIAVEWKHEKAEVDDAKHKVTVKLPEQTRLCYINITDDRNCTVSSNLIEVK